MAGTTTDTLGLYKPGIGEEDYGALVNANFDTLDSLQALGKTMYFSNFFPVGYIKDGTVDYSTEMQAALDAVDTLGGGRIWLNEAGTYKVGTALTIGDFTSIYLGPGVIVKLADAANVHIFTNKDYTNGNTDIKIYGAGTIDGNKTNQTAGQEARGVYLVRTTDSGVEGITVQDCEDHGIHFSLNGTEKGNYISNTLTQNNGLSDTSVGGSGVAVTNALEFRALNARSYGNNRAGFKPTGNHIEMTTCIASGNKDVGLTAPSSSFLVVNGGEYTANTSDVLADGIRLVATDRVILNGPNCSGNDGSGVMILNGCDNVTINGGQYYNNGQNATARAATSGRDGITIKNNGTVNTGINISNVQCFDTQGTKTQDYGIAIENTSNNITVTSSDLRNNQTGPLLNTSTGIDIRIDGEVRGVSYNNSDYISTTDLTGSTAETILESITIPADEFGKRNAFKVCAGGRITDVAAGLKTVRLEMDDGVTQLTSPVISTTGAEDWIVEMDVYAINQTAQNIFTRGWEGTTMNIQDYISGTIDFSNAVTVRITGQLANASDTIHARLWKVKAVK